MVKIFDTHAHYDDEWFDEDRSCLIESLAEGGVKKVCNIGATLKGCTATMEFIRKYDFFYGAVGIHPTEIGDLETAYDEALGPEIYNNRAFKLIKDYAIDCDRVVAIGEIGLDYHLDDCDDIVKNRQKLWFERQMELARELKLPIVVHSRDAAADTMDVMKACRAWEIGGVIHCYSYSAEMAKQYVDMGFFIGVGGVVTFKNGKRLKETVAAIPLENIVLETDAPYMAPEPFRGTRNSSLLIPKTAEAIAGIKGVSVDTVYEQTFINAHRLYNIRTDRQ